MAASVPWSVNAVDPEVWAAARRAARRSGLSVGKWLETTIRESAIEAERAHHEHARGSPDLLEHKLDYLADQLQQFMHQAAEPPAERAHRERFDSAVAASLEALNKRVDSLIQDSRSEERAAPSEMRLAIQRLNDRIEDLAARIRQEPFHASPELERRLTDEVRYSIQRLHDRIDDVVARGRREPTQTSSELDRKLADEMRSAVQRLNERIDNLATQARSSAPDIERKVAEEIRSAVQPLNDRIERLARSRHDGPPSLHEIERRLADEIRSAVQPLNERINLLAMQAHRDGSPGLLEIERKLADEIRSAVRPLSDRIDYLAAQARRELAPASHEIPRKLADEIRSAVQPLTDRIDLIALQARRDPVAPSQDIERKLSDEIRSAVQRLTDRIDFVALQARREPVAPSHEVERKLSDEIRSAVQRLNDRIDDLVRNREQTPRTPAEIERKLNDISEAVEDLGRRLERETGRPPASSDVLRSSVAELDAAIADIMMRQSVLDGVPRYPRQPASQPAPDFSGLESKLKNMADDIQALRQSAVPSMAVEALHRQMGEVAHKISDLAPRKSLDALEASIEGLARRLDAIARRGPDQSTQEVVRALNEIRSGLANVRPAESFTQLEGELRDLLNKLDALNSKGVDGDSLSRLQEQTDEIRHLLSSALPSDVLKALVDQVEILVAKLEAHSSPAEGLLIDQIAAFDRRIDSLSEQLEIATRQIPGAEVVEDIRSRLEALQGAISRSGSPASPGLEATVREIAEKIDATEARLANLSVIERGIGEISTQLRELRASAERFGDAVERPTPNMRVAPETAPQAAHAPPGFETRYTSAIGAPPIAPPPLRPAPPRIQPEVARGAAIASELPPDPAMDYPLEPGSGSPGSQGPIEPRNGIALDDLGAGEATSIRTSEFIAAARRAARAASEPVSVPPPPHATIDNPSLFARSRRALFIAITAFLVLFTALRYFDGLPLDLLQSEPAPSKLEPKKEAPKSAPAKDTERAIPESRSEAPKSELDFAGTPPAGVIALAHAPWLEARSPEPSDTGSITDERRPGTAVHVVAARRVAGTGDAIELPPSIGSPALRAAALAGDRSAAYEIGARYYEGRGVSPDPAAAFAWFERAFAKGSPQAAYRLGSMYEKGDGVPKNLKESERYYIFAAEAGNVKAMHNLAVLHAEGGVGKADYRTAAHWFRKAAERGVRDSQYNLGVLYARGLGVEQNLAESYRWFALAAAQGDADAAKKRDDVAGRLDMQTLLAAKLAVQTWSAVPTDESANATGLKPEWEKAEVVAPRKRAVKN